MKEIILVGVIVILIVVVIIFVISSINMRNNLKAMEESIKEISKEDTNAMVRLSSSNKYLINLTNVINQSIRRTHELKKEIMKEENKMISTITNLSHDLRTPITSILGYTQLLKKGLLTDKQTEYIKIIEERIKHLKELVDELYEYSLTYDEKDINLEKADIKPLIEETLLLFYKDFTDKNFRVIVNLGEDKILKTTDISMLKRVFYNIVSNALKYGKDYFEIYYEDNKLFFKNNVSNIDYIDINKIFDRFFTVARARTSGSTGLGLSISKKIMEDLDGKIYAEIHNDILAITIEF